MYLHQTKNVFHFAGMIYFLATQNVTDVLVSVHTGEWCSRYRLSEDFVQMTVHFHWVTLQHTNSPIQEIQDNTVVDFHGQRYDSFSRVVDSWWSFIPPCGFCWLPRGVVYTMCTPRIYHLYLSALHSVNDYYFRVQHCYSI